MVQKLAKGELEKLTLDKWMIQLHHGKMGSEVAKAIPYEAARQRLLVELAYSPERMYAMQIMMFDDVFTSQERSGRFQDDLTKVKRDAVRQLAESGLDERKG